MAIEQTQGPPVNRPNGAAPRGGFFEETDAERVATLVPPSAVVRAPAPAGAFRIECVLSIPKLEKLIPQLAEAIAQQLVQQIAGQALGAFLPKKRTRRAPKPSRSSGPLEWSDASTSPANPDRDPDPGDEGTLRGESPAR